MGAILICTQLTNREHTVVIPLYLGSLAGLATEVFGHDVLTEEYFVRKEDPIVPLLKHILFLPLEEMAWYYIWKDVWFGQGKLCSQ